MQSPCFPAQLYKYAVLLAAVISPSENTAHLIPVFLSVCLESAFYLFSYCSTFVCPNPWRVSKGCKHPINIFVFFNVFPAHISSVINKVTLCIFYFPFNKRSCLNVSWHQFLMAKCQSKEHWKRDSILPLKIIIVYLGEVVCILWCVWRQTTFGS